MTYPSPFPPPLVPRGWHAYDQTCGCAGCVSGEVSSPCVKVPRLDVANMSYEEVVRADRAYQKQQATNVAAIIALTCAVVGMVVLPILLGPIAIVAGVVGEHQARTEGRKLGKVALGGIVIGAIVTLIAVDRILPLVTS